MRQNTQSKTCVLPLTFHPTHVHLGVPIRRTPCLPSKNPVTKDPQQDYQCHLHPATPACSAIFGENPIDLNICRVLSRPGPCLESPDKILTLAKPLTQIYRANASTKEAIPGTSQVRRVQYVGRLSLPNIGSTENLLAPSREDWTKSNKITTLNAYLQDRCERNSANKVSNPSQPFITGGNWCCLTSRRVHGRP